MKFFIITITTITIVFSVSFLGAATDKVTTMKDTRAAQLEEIFQD